jgi:hypothetical protein
MKHYSFEYYDWVDKEWKPCPEYADLEITEDQAKKEYKALLKGGAYRKTKVRMVATTQKTQ